MGTHWNTIGKFTDQDTREKFYNDQSNHQVICTFHNSQKRGPEYCIDVGPGFKGPGE